MPSGTTNTRLTDCLQLHAQHHHFDAHDTSVQSGMMISYSKDSDVSNSVSEPPPSYSGP